MIVMKFGGTSVGSSERIEALFEIVRERFHRKPIVVVSALNGVTDSLIRVALEASSGNYDSSYIRERHESVISELGLDPNIIKEELEELEIVLKGISYLKELSAKTLDLVMSFGERLSAKIIANYFNYRGIKTKAFNSYDIGLMTDSNFGNAEVLEESYSNIANFFSKLDVLPIVTGFIAKDKKGKITTLGRGGSDYTATIIGAAVNAEEVQIWTDVDGIMTADPKICPKARSLHEVDYDEASELAFLGAKVLHPKTIIPVKSKGIPVRVLNSFNPSFEGTLIKGEVNRYGEVISVVRKSKMKVINIQSPKMFMVHGFLYKIFQIFNELQVPVDMLATSEINVSLTIEEKFYKEELYEELSKIAKVDVLDSRATLALVGRGVTKSPKVIKRAFNVLEREGINAEMISAGASEISLGFALEEKVAEYCVRELHKEFFENG